LIRSHPFRLVLSAFFVSIVLGAAVAHAGSVSLVVTPTRVVLDDRHRSQDIQVISLSNERLSYEVDTEHYMQAGDGTLSPARQKTKRQELAEKMIRFSPRRATLAPKGTQVVRLVYRAPQGLPDGEYRLHMSVQPTPLDSSAAALGTGEGGSDQAAILDIYVGISIPVFVRVGESSAKVAVTGATFASPKGKPGAPGLKVGFKRSGNRSTFGDVSVIYKRPGDAKGRLLGRLPGIPIYYPNENLEIVVPLDLKSGEALKSLAGGSIEVLYQDAEGDQGEVLASSTFNL
jgi:P pilus assembly chaperone PapD